MLLLLLLLPVCLALVLALLMDISWLSCPTRCILVGQGNSVMRFLVLKAQCPFCMVHYLFLSASFCRSCCCCSLLCNRALLSVIAVS